MATIEDELKQLYLRRAIDEYEYSWASEYEKRAMSTRAVTEGTVDIDPNNASENVETAPDGAWVRARVWVPKEWLDSK